jgi:hypothetical protein
VWLDGPRGRIPAVGVPSASAATQGHNHPAAYNLFTVSGHAEEWRCDYRVRGFAKHGSAGEASIGEIGKVRLI